MFRSLILTFLLAVMAPGTTLTAAEELAPPVVVAADENEIPKYRELTLTVDLTGAPADAHAVLEFTAWHRTEIPRGFFSTLSIYWDGKELTEALNRPPTFTMPRLSREEPTRRGVGFMVAALPAPEEMDAPGNRYYVPKDQVDMLFFRFLLPNAEGTHKLKIRNRLTGQRVEPLVIKDATVRFVKDVDAP